MKPAVRNVGADDGLVVQERRRRSFEHRDGEILWLTFRSDQHGINRNRQVAR